MPCQIKCGSYTFADLTRKQQVLAIEWRAYDIYRNPTLMKVWALLRVLASRRAEERARADGRSAHPVNGNGAYTRPDNSALPPEMWAQAAQDLSLSVFRAVLPVDDVPQLVPDYEFTVEYGRPPRTCPRPYPFVLLL
jgi:hypothetical protein